MISKYLWVGGRNARPEVYMIVETQDLLIMGLRRWSGSLAFCLICFQERRSQPTHSKGHSGTWQPLSGQEEAYYFREYSQKTCFNSDPQQIQSHGSMSITRWTRWADEQWEVTEGSCFSERSIRSHTGIERRWKLKEPATLKKGTGNTSLHTPPQECSEDIQKKQD